MLILKTTLVLIARRLPVVITILEVIKEQTSPPSIFSATMQRTRQAAIYLRYLLQLITGKGLQAEYFSGTLPGTNTPVNLLFMGSVNCITKAFFNGDAKPDVLGSFHPFFRKQMRARFSKPDTDIVVVPHLPWSHHNKDSYIIPEFLEAKLMLPASMDEFMATLRSDNRRKVKQALKVGFEFEIANSEEDYRDFYTQMLVPLVTHRHGVSAFVVSFENLYAQAPNATLVFVKHNGQRLGGVQLIWPSASKPYTYFNKIGMIDEVIHDIKRYPQVNMALYYRMCESTIEQGSSCLHLGMVPPILNSGLLWFKGSWGADFFVNSTFHRYEVIFCSKKRQEIQEQQHYLIHLEGGKLVATIHVTDEMMADPDTVGQFKRGQFDNLSRIDLVYPDGRVEYLS